MSQLHAGTEFPLTGTDDLSGPASPQATLLRFFAALNDEDLEASAHCFARDSCFLTPDATAIRSRDSIRAFLAQLIDAGHRIDADLGTSVIAGDVAFSRDRLTTVSAGATGVPFKQHSLSTTVLRHIEGSWKLLILAPWETEWRA